MSMTLAARVSGKRMAAGRRFAAVSAVLMAVGAARGQSSFAGLGIPTNAVRSVVTQLSADGNTAVGVLVSEPANWHGCVKEEALRWSVAGGLTNLVVPTNALLQRALGVSGDGSVMVGELTTPYTNGMFMAEGDAIEGMIKPFRWSVAGGLEMLAVPVGSDKTGAVAVSADGTTTVGYMDSEDGYQACRWTSAGGLQGLGFFPDGIESRALAVSSNGSVVVGFGQHAAGVRAFRWTAADGMQNLGILTNGSISRAAGVSADGAVVVGVVEGNSGDPADKRAFRWAVQQGMVELDAPAGTDEATAMAVSADGSVVVGLMTDTNAWTRAFVWDATNGMRSVKSVLTAAGVDTGTWRLDMAMGISADGRVVVGTGANTNHQGEAWRAVLPAP